MIDLGAYVEATVTISWSAERETPAGQRTVRIVFARTTNGYRFHSVRTLGVPDVRIAFRTGGAYTLPDTNQTRDGYRPPLFSSCF